MPVKSKRFPSNGIYEGKITGLDESEKEALENAGVGGNVDGKDISPKNVSVSGKLTINSSSDIVTKDGSKVGGSSLPITNNNNSQMPEEGAYLIAYDRNIFADCSAYGLTTYIGNKDSTVLTFNTQFIDGGYMFQYKNFASIDGDFIERFNITGLFTLNESLVAIPNIGISFVATGGGSPNKSIEYIIDFSTNNNNNNITIPSGTGTLAFTKDIPQYNHFITLKSEDSKYILYFNAYTKDNAPIASLNDLYSKLHNTYFMCNGKADTLVPYAIHIGTSASDTTITGDGTISISSFTIVTDNVTETN